MFSLKEMFGSTVKVSLDPSWDCPWPGGKTDEDKLWCYEIVGKRGTIYPQSETEVCVATSQRIGKRLITLFGSNCHIHRVCDEGMDVIVPVKLTASTFRYIKPVRRRHLSETRKEVLTHQLRASQRP